MNSQKLVALVLATLATTANAEQISTPDGFDLSKLYGKLKGSITQSSAEKIINDDFNEAMTKGVPPKRLFAYAKKGNQNACNMVGYLFDAGKGLKQDSAKAAKWFAYCAKTNPKAAYNIGTMLAEGRGVKKDIDKAEPYLKMAWNGMKSPQAGIRLAYLYRDRQDWANEWEWVSRLEQGKKHHKHWGYLMGEMILNKTAPIYDPSKANVVLTLALEQRSAGAASLLADSFGYGQAGEIKLVDACSVEFIGTSISGKPASKWMNRLEEADQDKCKAIGTKWLESHEPPRPTDFQSLIY